MRTFDRIRANRGAPTNVTVRLVTMLAMLGVLVMLIVRARNPDTWRWLANDPNDKQAAKSDAAAAPIPQVAVTAPRELVSRGPTDTDTEELASAVEEMQAISDGTLEMQPEEMPAYWRVFSWVDRQSFAVLQGRATKTAVFNDFMQHSGVSRRRIVQLELNVRRVLRYDAPENHAGIKQVYEIWGPTDESQAWPYVVVTPHLPPGMPTGTDVYERVTLVGYFFKLQGYHAAGASPQDKPLAAPLFIGRLAWHPSPARVAPKQDSSWIWWLGLAAVPFGGVRLGLWWYGRAKPATSKTVRPAEVADSRRLDDWLRQTETSDDEFSGSYEDHSLDDLGDPATQYGRRNGQRPHDKGEV